ncbi:DUF2157 domain-containing protein [Marinicauda sp. Alg238-R41]|jgi:uncharacterized membrane protein|uniref:DUF2157 domain-containing protein n=1 Tax=Marinicauda sp. Alg238-R41 TaxID=2993447 RepID=UPI0022E41DD3|nr:DUF2157 domain-containing protein [Marinicauda sp. Alg238-R41]
MSYRKRLERDLDGWIERGLVPQQSREPILSSVPERRAPWSVSGAAALLGAILVSLAVLSFVAANWAGMERATRFVIILVALWASFGTAAFASWRGKGTGVVHAAALIGAVLFGAAIMLTAQTFNISAFRNTGLLIWAVGALATALVIPSRPALILATLIGAGWLGAELANTLAPDLVWGYLPLWLVMAGCASALRSRIAAHILSLSLFAWLAFMLERTGNVTGLTQIQSVSLFVLIAALIAVTGLFARERNRFGAGILGLWALALGLAGGWALQFPLESLGARDAMPTASLPGLAAAGIVTLAVFAVLALRVRTRAMALPVALLGALAAGLVLALPALAHALDPSAVFVLRLVVGALIFALAAALIASGAREGRRVAGTLGILLFIAQCLYVYATLFGSLLSTAVFFLAGGVLLFAVSLVAARVQLRLNRTKGESR